MKKEKKNFALFFVQSYTSLPHKSTNLGDTCSCGKPCFAQRGYLKYTQRDNGEKVQIDNTLLCIANKAIVHAKISRQRCRLMKNLVDRKG